MQYNIFMNKRIDTFSVKIGDIFVGSKHPIRVQSMTNTLTANIDATVAQIIQLHDAGSEIVRITVNDEDSAISVEKIKNKLVKMNCNVPLVGDFHFNGHLLLSSYPDAAAALDKYRINPGNIGGKTKFDNNFEKIINIAIKNNKPVRIGANWGSLKKETMDELLRQKEASDKEISYSELIKNALVKSVIESASKAISLGLPENNIILSCKTSNVSDLIDIYTDLSSQCRYPLHLGLT